MEWLSSILKDVEGGEEIAFRIRTELPKNFIPKDKYNEAIEQKRLLQQQLDSGADERVRGIAIDAAMKAAAKDFKLKDVDVARLLISNDEITVSEDGQVSGIDEQIKLLKKQRPYLFGDDTLAGRTPVLGGGNAPAISKEQFKKMGYRQRLEIFNDNPELYEHLKN